MQVTALSSSPYSLQKHNSSWKETLLISAVALAALASFVQLLVGSFTVAVTFGILGSATYIGYKAQTNLTLSLTQKEFYAKLYKNTEELKKETSSFRLENKIMTKNNQNLTEQVELLTEKLEHMQNLLAKLDAAAVLTKDLLHSCIDVSDSQKQTENRIHILLDKLERISNVTTQKEIETHVKQLESTIQSMGQQITQFFLHDAKAANLLEVKKEFVDTSEKLEFITEELHRVQKELSFTSSRLDGTSENIDIKLKKLNETENKLNAVKLITQKIINISKNKEIKKLLSWDDLELIEQLEKNWKLLQTLS